MGRDAAATKDRILAVAREAFARHGFDGTTVRSIASEAEVAPNLITRYFGGKAGLFECATRIDLGVADVLVGPFPSLGERLAAKVVARWEGAGAEDPLLMMLRSAGTSDETAAHLGTFFLEQAAQPLAAHLAAELGCRLEEAHDRVAGVGALIMGVVMTRYVMRTGPLAVAGPERITAWLGERIQRLLGGPAPPALRPTGGGRSG